MASIARWSFQVKIQFLPTENLDEVYESVFNSITVTPLTNKSAEFNLYSLSVEQRPKGRRVTTTTITKYIRW